MTLRRGFTPNLTVSPLFRFDDEPVPMPGSAEMYTTWAVTAAAKMAAAAAQGGGGGGGGGVDVDMVRISFYLILHLAFEEEKQHLVVLPLTIQVIVALVPGFCKSTKMSVIFFLLGGVFPARTSSSMMRDLSKL